MNIGVTMTTSAEARTQGCRRDLRLQDRDIWDRDLPTIPWDRDVGFSVQDETKT